MGAWGITERQSDHGLDLLEIIVARQLREVDFATFNVSEARELLRQDTQNEIEQYRQKERPPALKEFYLETLTHSFIHAEVLIAECLADYYQTGELTIYDYVGENYDPIEYRIKDFIVSSADFPPLLEVLRSVQSPEHWLYQSWCDEDTRQRWLAHIQSVQRSLKEHYEKVGL